MCLFPRFLHQFALRDRLGSTRIMLKDRYFDARDGYRGPSGSFEPEVLQVNDYYPFGLNHETQVAQQSKDVQFEYTGKERIKDLSVNYNDPRDNGVQGPRCRVRWYNASLGRWVVVDPLADQMPSYSPYVYGFNNPIRFTDPTGMAPVGPGDPPKALLWVGQKVANFLNNSVPAGAKSAVGAFNYARETRVGSFVEGMANNTAAAVVDVGTTTTFPVINQLGVIANEGVHEGGAYSEDSNILPTTYTLTEDWSLVPQEEMATMSASDSEKRGKQLMQNTVKVLTTAAPSPGTAAGKAAATGAKAVINKAAEKLLEVEDNTSSGNPSGA